MEKYKFLIEGLNFKNNNFGNFWKPLWLLRWLGSMVVLVQLRYFFCLQIIILLIISVIFQILIISVKPFNEASDNLISIINEVMNSIYLCILLSLSGLQPTSVVREELGWGLVWISLTTVFANFSKLIYEKGRSISKNIMNKKKINKNIVIDQS